ncbi:MAG: hypothetical protein GC157_10320 [Frankiales bacterium]|nr:hypothetical protein [Frankiales bacterium]
MSSRDESNWAAKVERLEVSDELAAAGFNVAGRRLAGAQQGFGRLWQRRYAVDLGDAVTPEQVVADWKQRFPTYWPDGATFHVALTGLRPGVVSPIAIASGAPGLTVSTGIMVLYMDDTSFTFMCPEGHMFAGWITFESERSDAGTTVAEVQILIRTSDPLYELGWPVMKRKEDAFWSATLRNLAKDHGVADVPVWETTTCVDRRRLWRNWRNVRHNSGMRSAWHSATSPFRGTRAA